MKLKKTFFIIFKGLPVVRNCVKPESGALKQRLPSIKTIKENDAIEDNFLKEMLKTATF